MNLIVHRIERSFDRTYSGSTEFVGSVGLGSPRVVAQVIQLHSLVHDYRGEDLSYLRLLATRETLLSPSKVYPESPQYIRESPYWERLGLLGE